MRNFRELTAEEIECRIGTISEKGISLLLYKTARTDAKLLDEIIGVDRWQNEYKVINGNLYCGIGINYPKKDGTDNWVWKWNCGVESATEKEKGEASDALKRAGFTWGIGTELYSSPFIWIPKDSCNIKLDDKTNKWKCTDKFSVAEIEYDENSNICKLYIRRNYDDGYVYTFPKIQQSKPATKPVETKHAEVKPEAPKQETPTAKDGSTQELKFKCHMCGETLQPYMGTNGKMVGLRQHAEASKAKFGNVTCIDCMRKYGLLNDNTQS